MVFSSECKVVLHVFEKGLYGPALGLLVGRSSQIFAKLHAVTEAMCGVHCHRLLPVPKVVQSPTMEANENKKTILCLPN